SAPASRTPVSLCVVRVTPRSRSLTERALRPAASASSSCVSLASVRSCRSSPAKLSSGSATDPPAFPRNLPAVATRHGCTNRTLAQPAWPPSATQIAGQPLFLLMADLAGSSHCEATQPVYRYVPLGP